MADDTRTPQQTMSRLRRIGKRVGQAVTAFAVVFLAWELYRQWGNVKDWRPTVGQVGLLVAFSLFYGASLFVLACNWLTILNTLVVERLPARPVLMSYTQTQIAKYVPGNVLHFVSRHMYLRALGLPHRPIALATLFELVSLPIAALFAVSILLPFADVTDIASVDQRLAYLLPFFGALSLTVGAVVLSYRRQQRLIRPTAVVLARATGFMLFQGLVFALILQMISSEFVFIALPIAILAWLIGFVTPGAPGGVAVREALLIKLLAIAALQEDILIAAVLFRLVTSAGDLAVYGFGHAFVVKTAAQPARDQD
jgi:hypothetical protein